MMSLLVSMRVDLMGNRIEIGLDSSKVGKTGFV